MAPSEPSLQGNLQSFSIQDVMSFLSQIRASGCLEVRAKEGELSIFWNDGIVTWSTSSIGGADAGDLLVHRGHLEAGKLVELRSDHSEGNLASLLVDEGIVEPSVVDGILAEKVGEAIYRIFLWTPDRFRFQDDVSPPEGVRTVTLDAQGLLLEGARRCDEWERLPAVFRDPRTTFELMAEPKSDDMVSLSLDEWRHLYLVNGCRSLSAIWEASPVASDLEISAILFGLSSARLIRAEEALPEDQQPAIEEPVVDVPYEPSPAVVANAGFETLSLDALKANERKEREKELDEVTTKSMPPSSIRRLSLSQVRIQSVGRLVALRQNLPRDDYLIDRSICTLGRSPDCDVVLADGHVSARHAEIAREGHHFVLRDLDSANGLTVGGKETRRTFLRGGEIIEIYPYQFRFELEFDVSEN